MQHQLNSCFMPKNRIMKYIYSLFVLIISLTSIESIKTDENDDINDNKYNHSERLHHYPSKNSRTYQSKNFNYVSIQRTNTKRKENNPNGNYEQNRKSIRSRHDGYARRNESIKTDENDDINDNKYNHSERLHHYPSKNSRTYQSKNFNYVSIQRTNTKRKENNPNGNYEQNRKSIRSRHDGYARRNANVTEDVFRRTEKSKNSNSTMLITKKTKTTKNSSEDTIHNHSNDNGDFGLLDLSFLFRKKYSHARKRNINTRGYQTFYGKRRRGSKSHVRTTFRKRSRYDYNGRKNRSSTFESYGEADSFDRKKIRDVYDVIGQANEKRERTKLGGYIENQRHVVVSGSKKDNRWKKDSDSSEKSQSSEKNTGNQESNHQENNRTIITRMTRQ
ncbi:unnamed protein product [Schistosoma turkestanicum]|nr:unnamed protein product [Schistosoma turkestanicum]